MILFKRSIGDYFELISETNPLNNKAGYIKYDNMKLHVISNWIDLVVRNE